MYTNLANKVVSRRIHYSNMADVSDFNELRESHAKKIKVADENESDDLRIECGKIEEMREQLFTKENRRNGIQALYMSIIQTYHTVHRFSIQPFTRKRRGQFMMMRKYINDCRNSFYKRFVHTTPTITPRPRRGVFPVVQQSPIRDALLNIVGRRPAHPPISLATPL
uniref:Uncharacterized protein n=2 Tax=Caenorhabditis tropicalis TaxID=1561998 RepID=A0A1I7T202_9PELO